jgi:sigma-E factor negative regulatory protein RseC
MNQLQEGIVDSLEGGFARIRFEQHEGCSSCGACGGAGVTILAENGIGALPQDRVTVEASTGGQLSIAFVLFMLPLAMIFLGAAVGHFIAILLSLPSTLASVTGSVFLFALSLACVIAFDRKTKAGARAPFRIIAIHTTELED